MDDLSGQTIRGYQILERIGEGGFGVVYRAHQPVVKRDVVVKAILPVYANNPDFIRSFEAEAQLIARLEHLHIVPLYDYWRGPEGAFLVMRWLRGGSILDRLPAGPWQIDEVVRLTNQVTAALAAAHRNNIIHQDIKPANILLDEEGNAYLTDFGLAKDLETNTDLSVSTLNNTSVRGSPAYISPEQIRRHTITPKTDIYSLGIVLFELLCGEHPYGMSNIVELLRHQLNTQLPSLQKYRPDLPDSLNFVLWRATAKEPDVRYATVIEMAEAFHNAIRQHSGEVSPAPTEAKPTRSITQPITGVISLSDIDALIAGPPNPYKGLRAFQEADVADFFGRDALTESLMQRLTETGEGQRFLAVVGPSGSGKSSIIKAGLIPAMRSGRIPGWQKWFIVEMTPGERPLAELEIALLKIAPRHVPDMHDMLEQEDGLTRVAHTILGADNPEVILIIDQFEEVFTRVADEQERAHFLNLLHDAVIEPESCIRIIVTLRADFYDRPLLYAGFGELIRRRTEVILPMSATEIEQAIVAPAERVGLILEEGLADQIIADVVNQPSVLPLLQFTLSELYERRSNNQLLLESYRSTGGVSGALARRANELYAQMTARQQVVVEQIFLRLVTPGEGAQDTRRRALQSEFMSMEGAESDVQQVIEIFGRYRLLTFDRDPTTRTPTIEVAHEALIRHWDKLREWLDQNRDSLRMYRVLTAAAAEWNQSGQDSSFLASGTRLGQFESLALSRKITFTDIEKKYLESSLRRRASDIRIRKLTTALLVSMVIGLAILSLVALIAQNTAVAEGERANQTARIARSRELAASALVEANQAALPLLLSLEALAISDTFEARNSLLTTLQRYPRLNTVLSGHTDWLRSTAYSPDGSLIASAGRDSRIIIWDAQERRMTGEPLVGHNGWINTVTFSPNNHLLASGGEDGVVFLWDLTTSPPTAQALTGHTQAVWSAVFSPDGRILASAGADRTIRLWDIQTGMEIASRSDHTNIVYALAFNHDGTLLASGSADNTVRLWDASSLEPLHVLEGHGNWVMSVSFDVDGVLLATGGADNSVRLWDVETARPISGALLGHRDWVRTLHFFPDTRRLASGGADGVVLIWDITTGTVVDNFAVPGSPAIWSLDISPDSQNIVTGGAATDVYVWESQSRPALSTLIAAQPEQITAAASSADGAMLATAGGVRSDFAVHLWRTSDFSVQSILKGHASQITGLAFHPTMPWLASSSVDRTIIIWDVTSGQQLAVLQLPDSIFAIAFNAQGTRLAAGDNTGTVTIWETEGSPASWGASSRRLTGHTDRVLSAAFHPNGTLLASGSRDRTIRLWDTEQARIAGEPLTAHSDSVLGLTFSPDGALLASGSRDTTIRLWSQSGANWQPDGEPLRAHINWVMDVEFSPDGAMLASASGDGTVILWHVEQRAPLGRPLVGHGDWVNTLVFSPDNARLYSGGRDGLLLAWVIGLQQWQHLACHIANRNLLPDEQQRYLHDTIDPVRACPNPDEEIS